MGRTLHPFSLGHKVILHTLASPLIIGGPVTVADIATGAYVCSLSFVDARAAVFGIDQSWRLDVAQIGMDNPSPDLAELFAAWNVYSENHTKCPLHWESEDDAGETRAPWEFHLVVFLCDVMNMTEAQAWDTPLNLARCYFDTWREKQGDKSLVSDYEKAKAPFIGTDS